MRSNKGPSVLTRREALIAGAGLGAGFALGRTGKAGAKEQAAQPGEKMCVLTPPCSERKGTGDEKFGVLPSSSRFVRADGSFNFGK